MTNRLAASSSPYLLQHADNPVDWWEWDEQALAVARDEDRPILLSVGYSACHWCHVMAHESFEDPGTAEVMNRLFVNIKVDREQRPDLDRIYQLAFRVMNRRPGGWPLTAFLDPHNQQPLFVGTYFPRAPRQGMPAFVTVLERVAQWYREEPEQRMRQNESLAAFFSRQQDAPTTQIPTAAALDGAQAALERAFDPEHGGFGSAPKFPQATQLRFLLRRDDDGARQMALHTLGRICRSGLLDQIGGGFYRYSVDERWEIPHFEKMLSDNGLLLTTLAEAASDDPMVERAARLTAAWVMREMQHTDGGYYTSLDADSEGREGAYYVWDREAVQAAVSSEAWRTVAGIFGLDRAPNFEGRWHLQLYGEADPTNPLLGSATATLLATREARPRPARDDKVLAGWNGLMIKGMAMAGRAWNEPGWVASAQAAAHFARRELWQDGRLCTSWRNGTVLPMAFLDDYAYLLDALVTLVECDHDEALLEFAHRLADCMLERFPDPDGGGFFFTADDHEPLIQRPKSFDDDATPNGNGIAALALLRLGQMSGESRYTVAAERTVDATLGRCGEWPHAHAACLLALMERLDPQPAMCKPPGLNG